MVLYEIIYCMSAIITRGLYTFYPIFEGPKRFIGAFFVKFWPYVQLVFKSGLQRQAYCNSKKKIVYSYNLKNSRYLFQFICGYFLQIQIKFYLERIGIRDEIPYPCHYKPMFEYFQPIFWRTISFSQGAS